MYVPLAVAHPSWEPALKLGVPAFTGKLELVHAVNRSDAVAISTTLIVFVIIFPCILYDIVQK